MTKTIWFTGLSCAGKTTLALRLKEEIEKKDIDIIHFDGDNIRKTFSKDLTFSLKDREENIRRVSKLCGDYNKEGKIVLATFISPTKKIRTIIKKNIDNLSLIFVKCSLEECERRDVKGLYKKARQGLIKDFTGITSPFEEPDDKNTMIIDTENNGIEECVKKIIENI